MTSMEIDKIVVGNRFRKSVGDLDPLMRSIESLGLLQPIGVDSDNYLVYGERRLRACAKIGWTEIPVVVVDCPPLKAERDENEERKPFTVEEKLFLAEAISKGLGRTQGKRVDLLPENSPEVEYKHEETRDIAAREAGLGSSATLRQAKKVVDSGDQEIIDKMNSSEITINKAHTLVKEKTKVSNTKEESAKVKDKPEKDSTNLNLKVTICIEIEGYKIELTKQEWEKYLKVIRKELSQI